MLKKIQVKIRRLLLIMLLVPAGVLMADPPLGQLEVHVSNINNNKGAIRAVLFNSKQSYQYKGEAVDTAYREVNAKVVNQQSVFTIKYLPYGEYAIKMFHDEDMSGSLKKNFIGIPKEDVAFSNNPVIKHSEPTFEQTKFLVNQPKTVIYIRMIHF